MRPYFRAGILCVVAFRLEGHEQTGEFEDSWELLGLWRKRINYSVHGSSCAFDHTVADIFGRVHSTFRNVFRCSHRSRLNRGDGAHGNAKRENYRNERFHGTK